MKLAWFRPRPLDRAEYFDETAALIAQLRSTHDITVFTADNAHDFVWMHFRAPYDLCIHELDDTAAHQFIWPYLMHYGGILLLNTLTLNDSRSSALAREGRTADYRAEFAFSHSWAMLRAPLLAARLVLVAHAATAVALQDEYPEARVRFAPTGVREVQGVQEVQRVQEKSTVTFGVLDRGRLGIVERALQRARDGGAAAALMTDASPAHVLQHADVILALRWPTSGEPLTPAIAGMAAGKPVVVYEIETTADWPALNPQTWQPRGLSGDAPIVVSVDLRDEEHSLMLAIRGLATDQTMREQLGGAARTWWRAHGTVAHAADAWQPILLEAISLVPPARPADWPAHLTADGTEGARAILGEFGESVDFLT